MRYDLNCVESAVKPNQPTRMIAGTRATRSAEHKITK